MSAAVPETPPALRAAREFVARGWRPFPVEYGGKRPAVGIKWGTATAIEPTEETLALWFGRNPVNVGLAAKGSGLVILDDDAGDGMERLCEAYGRPVPETYRVRTRKGWHYYFTAPADLEIGNSPGFLADFGFDVRGGRGDGGYVVAAGSMHESEHVYEAEDPEAEIAELPDWLQQLLLVTDPDPEHAEDRPAAERRIDRRYTEDQAIAWVERYAVGPLKTSVEHGDPATGLLSRNIALNQAAVVAGHFVPEFWSEEWVIERLTELADDVGLPGQEVGPTIRSGLRAGMAEPYTKVEPRDPFASASDSSAAADPDAFEAEVDRKLRELRVAEEARRRLARERRANSPRIAEGVIDDLDSIPEPEMLLGSLIPERAVGFLAGRSGAYKSFLATSWACCIATGRPWLGRPEFAVSRPLKVLYVAAEGAAGAAGRIRAWEADTGVSRRGRLLLYPRPIHLNDSAQVEELVEYVVEHEIEFLVIDTYHRSAPGTEENSATEFGAVFDAVARLRDEHACSTLFIDHTGAQKAGNPRGTTAKRDDADYVLSSSYAGEEATAQAQRELFVTKLKDADTSGRWPVRLFDVEGERFPVVKLGLVDGPDALAVLGDWWAIEHCPVIPTSAMEAIDKAATEQRGRGRDSARWIWRLLAAIDDEQGLTLGEIKRMLKAAPPAEKFSEEIVKRGLTVLKKAGCAWQDGARIGLEEAQP